MFNLIRSEWIKFRSVRSTVILVVIAGLLVVVISFFAARDVNRQADNNYCVRDASGQTVDPSGSAGPTEATVSVDPGVVDDTQPAEAVEYVPCSELPADQRPPVNLGDLTVGLPFALFLLGALGVQVIGQEYRFNTIRPTFTAMPRRLRVLLAKLVVVSLACISVTVVMLALCAVVGSAMTDNFTIDGIDERVIYGTVLFSVGWSAMGMGVGAILRQPVAGILVLLGEALVLEQILAGLFPSLTKWMPFLNGIQMTVRGENSLEGIRTVQAGGIYFFVVAAALWILGAVLAVRRDA